MPEIDLSAVNTDANNLDADHERGIGYYARANVREILSTLLGDPRELAKVSLLGLARDFVSPQSAKKDTMHLAKGLLPGGITGTYGLVDALIKAPQLGADYVAEGLDEIIGRPHETVAPIGLPYGEEASDLYQRGREGWNDVMRTEEAKNTRDLVLGMGPSLLVGGGGVKTARTVADEIGNIAKSLVLPLRQNKLTSVAGATEVAAPLVLTEVIKALAPDAMPDYKSDLAISSAQATPV